MKTHTDGAAVGFDIAAIHCDLFFQELEALRREVDSALGEEDLVHLRKIERWGRTCTAVGALTAGIAPNPLSAACLALGRGARWMLMHHVGHHGYDRVPNVPRRYTSRVFARGRRRFLDWADWMIPAAWIYEHNVLHHANTGEVRDPDLIERNTENLRALPLPKAFRYLAMGFLFLTWRPGYYAPNTLRLWKQRAARGDGPAEHYDLDVLIRSFFDRDLWTDCYLPYATLQFVLFPLLYAPLGPWSVFSAWCNSLGAEVLTNCHTFGVVGPNHTGDDLYRFDARPANRAETCVRQVIASANYHTGNDLLDFLHLYLNYQIEHHIWPDLPMRQYRLVQPKVKALCEKYGIPYVQDSVLRRIEKMISVAVGNTSMRRVARARGAAGRSQFSNSGFEKHRGDDEGGMTP